MSERLTQAEREADLELAELDDMLEWSELVAELDSEDDELGPEAGGR